MKNIISEFLANSNYISVTATDFEGNYIYVNKHFEDRFRFMQQEFIGRPFMDTVHPLDHEKANEAALKIMQNPELKVPVQLRKPDEGDENYHWTQWEFSLLKDEHQQPIGILCVGYDITEVKHKADENRDLRTKYEAMINSTKDAMFLVGKNFEIKAFNKTAEEISLVVFGKALQVGKSIIEYLSSLSNKDQLIDSFKTALVGELVQKDIQISNVWVQISCYPIYDEQKKVAAFTVDIANIHQKKMVEEYRKALIRNVPDTLMVIDSKGTVIDYKPSKANPVFDAAKVIGQHYHALFPEFPQDLSKWNFYKDGNYFSFKLGQAPDYRYFDAGLSAMEQGSYLLLIRETTVKTKLKHQLIKQKDTYEAILEQSMAGYWDWNIKENTEYLSPTFKKMFGYEVTEMTEPASWQKLAHPEDLEKLLQNVEAHFRSKGKIPYRNEVRYTHKSGHTVWVICNGKVIEWDEEGKPLRMVGCHIDISSIKEAEIKQAELNRRFKEIGATAPGVIYQYNLKPDGTAYFTYVSKNVERLFETSQASLQADAGRVFDYVHKEDLEQLKESILISAQELSLWEVSFRLELPSGKRSWVRGSAIPQKKADGMVSWNGYLQDITETMEKKQLLEEKERKSLKIIESIPHPLLLVNENFEIQFVNDEFFVVFGYAKEEVIGRTVDFLLPQELRSTHRAKQESYLKNSKLYRVGVVPALNKNNQKIDVNITLNTVYDKGKKSIIAILQDVTELKKSQDLIIAQNEALSKIAQQQSHEVRRPLASILGLCELMNETFKEENQLNPEYLHYLLRSASELDAIIHKIVDESFKITGQKNS